MKTASTFFTIIGIITNLGVAIAYVLMKPEICWIFWLSAALCCILGISSTASTKKSVGLGIAMIFFVNVFAGVFYLCWDGNE